MAADPQKWTPGKRAERLQQLEQSIQRRANQLADEDKAIQQLRGYKQALEEFKPEPRKRRPRGKA
jgi:hypothetical protein